MMASTAKNGIGCLRNGNQLSCTHVLFAGQPGLIESAVYQNFNVTPTHSVQNRKLSNIFFVR